MNQSTAAAPAMPPLPPVVFWPDALARYTAAKAAYDAAWEAFNRARGESSGAALAQLGRLGLWPTGEPVSGVVALDPDRIIANLSGHVEAAQAGVREALATADLELGEALRDIADARITDFPRLRKKMDVLTQAGLEACSSAARAARGDDAPFGGYRAELATGPRWRCSSTP